MLEFFIFIILFFVVIGIGSVIWSTIMVVAYRYLIKPLLDWGNE